MTGVQTCALPIYTIEVFTTRPDTLFGATYLVLAPEHPLVASLLQVPNKKEAEEYIENAKRKTELQRKEEAGEKTGVELKGVQAINPANNEEIPVWVADYVLGGYGTGAIMAVPAHDERDWEFAKKFKLPIKKVVIPEKLAESVAENLPAGISGTYGSGMRIVSECWAGEGELINSGQFNGMRTEQARWEITTFVGGGRETHYKIRDWSVSRQRYWGVPIPMIHCETCGTVPVPDKDLPVKLPPLKDYRPKGVPPLASSKEFIEVK